MPSLSFDPVAGVYDATRGHPDTVALEIARAMEQSVDSATAQVVNTTEIKRFLEVGIGTGRIGLPLASLGHNYTGVDISEKMLAQLEAKMLQLGWHELSATWGSEPDEDGQRVAPVRRFTKHAPGMQPPDASMRVVQADMTQLPFRNAVFDVAVAVHVFHLVDGWEQALQEVLRLLRPGGYLLHCWDEYENIIDGPNVSEEWTRIVKELGGKPGRPGATSVRQVTEWLRERGYHSERIQATTWKRLVTPRESVERITKRLWSSTWGVPDDIFAQSVERLNRWLDTHYAGKLDTEYEQECKFIISKTRV